MTRFFQALTLALLLATTAPLAAGDATSVVTMDLNVGDGTMDYKTCDVHMNVGGTAGDLLDAAVASGCIDSWTFVDYGAWGRFVDCIDNVCGQSAAIFIGTFWEINLNGTSASVGIDEIYPENGDIVTFDYESYAFLP